MRPARRSAARGVAPLKPVVAVFDAFAATVQRVVDALAALFQLACLLVAAFAQLLGTRRVAARAGLVGVALEAFADLACLLVVLCFDLVATAVERIVDAFAGMRRALRLGLGAAQGEQRGDGE